MDSDTAMRLLDLNRKFYQTFGRQFSSTRLRVQPGVRRIMASLQGDEALLDLGCGNGELARQLARRGHRGTYTGLDFSRTLLEETGGLPGNFQFIETDLAGDWASRINDSADRQFQWVFAFAVLHHIPGNDLRLSILRQVHALLSPGGRFVHSEWQFLNSDKLRKHLQPWESAGFSSGQVDPGDHLIDWRQGGRGLRYVHAFEPMELDTLSAASGFEIRETFHSDGEGGNLGIYQVWSRTGPTPQG